MSIPPARPRLGYGNFLARLASFGRASCFAGLACLPLALGSCSSHRSMTIAAFERLHLEARLGRSHGAVGEMIPVRYSLLNLGRRGVRACVSYEAGFNEIGTRSALGSVLDSGGQTCKKPPFELGPGQTFEWDSQVQLLDIGPGMATLWTFVRIVDLASCGPHGCDARSLIPLPLSLKIVERRAQL